MNAPATKPSRFAGWPDDQPRPRDCDPTFTLERHIANARREVGEARWAALQAEWDTPTPCRTPDYAALGLDDPEGRN